MFGSSASVLAPHVMLEGEAGGGAVGLAESSATSNATPQLLDSEIIRADGGGVQPDGDAAAAPGEHHRPQCWKRALRITVNDPVKLFDGINSYVSYKVSTQAEPLPPQGEEEEDGPLQVDVHELLHSVSRSPSNLEQTLKHPSFTVPHTMRFEVMRRYSDFVWLVQQLTNEYPGCVVPPLPEKLLVGRFSPDFVESRRRALERFLSRVAQHPELLQSKHLALFLMADEEGLRVAKDESKVKAVPPTSKMMEMINATFSTMQYKSCSPPTPRPDLDPHPHDAIFDELTTDIYQLETQLQAVLRHSTTLVKKRKELAGALSDFGVSATVLGQSEKGMSASLQEVGKVSDSLSALGAAEAEKEGLQFEDSLAEYCRLVTSVKNALSKRQETRVAYGCALMDLENKRAIHKKLVKVSTRADRVTTAEAALARAQEVVEETQKELDIRSERFLRDFQRFKEEKATKLKGIMLSFVSLQADYHKTVEQAWVGLVPQLEAGGDEKAGGPAASSEDATVATESSAASIASDESEEGDGEEEEELEEPKDGMDEVAEEVVEAAGAAGAAVVEDEDAVQQQQQQQETQDVEAAAEVSNLTEGTAVEMAVAATEETEVEMEVVEEHEEMEEEEVELADEEAAATTTTAAPAEEPPQEPATPVATALTTVSSSSSSSGKRRGKLTPLVGVQLLTASAVVVGAVVLSHERRARGGSLRR